LVILALFNNKFNVPKTTRIIIIIIIIDKAPQLTVFTLPVFDVHVTVYRVKRLTIKPTRYTNFSNLFLELKSTCFGQFLCPSSRVFSCTHSNGICLTGLLTACEQEHLHDKFSSCIFIHPYSALRPVWQESESSQATGMALAHCILGKFLGVGCHCFPPPLDI